MKRICFVCMGNVCRSPTAEGVFKHLARSAGLDGQFHVESAAVGAWHVGERPDARSRQTARAHGVTLDCVAQQFKRGDFERFDLVVAMDEDVANDLYRLTPNTQAHSRVCLLREFDPEPGRDGHGLNVPDPYYGGPQGFEMVYQMIERSCRKLLEVLSGQPGEDRAGNRTTGAGGPT